MFVFPLLSFSLKAKSLKILLRVELLTVILPVRKNSNPQGSRSHVAQVHGKGIGVASEDSAIYKNPLIAKVSQVFLSHSNPLQPSSP